MVSTTPAPESIDDFGAHQRRDALGRLQAAVVVELDQTVVGDRRVGGEEQRDVDESLCERVRVSGPPASSSDDLAELQRRSCRLRPGRHSGRVGHSGGPPNDKLPATSRRSLSVCNSSGPRSPR